MSRTLYVAVVRVDALDIDDRVPGFDTEDSVETFGPFTSQQAAQDFCTGLQDELDVRLSDGAALVYGTLTFHACEIRWPRPLDLGPEYDDLISEQYVISREVDNWVHTKEA